MTRVAGLSGALVSLGFGRSVLSGSGGRVEMLFRRKQCDDQGVIELRRGRLYATNGLHRDPTTSQSIHCCYLDVRRTWIHWVNGRPVSHTVVAANNDRWPPQ